MKTKELISILQKYPENSDLTFQIIRNDCAASIIDFNVCDSNKEIQIRISLEDLPVEFYADYGKYQTLPVGSIAVDSGQLMITDPCYIERQWTHHTKRGDKGSINIGEYQYSYSGCCEASKSGPSELYFKSGISGAGIAFSTPHGDGEFPVFANYDQYGVLTKIWIDFNAELDELIDDM